MLRKSFIPYEGNSLMTVKIIQGIYVELNSVGKVIIFDFLFENLIGYTSDELCGKKWN